MCIVTIHLTPYCPNEERERKKEALQKSPHRSLWCRHILDVNISWYLCSTLGRAETPGDLKRKKKEQKPLLVSVLNFSFHESLSLKQKGGVLDFVFSLGVRLYFLMLSYYFSSEHKIPVLLKELYVQKMTYTDLQLTEFHVADVAKQDIS